MNIDKYLSKIQSEAPERFKNIVREEKTEYKDNFKGMAKEAHRRGKISSEQRAEIERMADRGDFDTTEKVTDENLAKEMKEFVDSRIARGLKSGELDKPNTRRYRRLTNRWAK
jgi:hypothetical protein